MKNSLLVITTILMVIITFVLGFFFNIASNLEKIKKTQIHVYPMQKAFIVPSEVGKLIKINDSSYIDIANLEAEIEKNDYIDNAEVYKDLNGRLIAEINQYQPIARVIGSRSYYIDKNGEKKPLSKHYTEKVVLIFGSIDTNNKEQIISLLKAMNKDKVLHKIITEIHINGSTNKLKTDLLSADIKIDLNANLDQQLYKLKAIYSYLIKQKKAKKYSQIDLRYDKQAVCK